MARSVAIVTLVQREQCPPEGGGFRTCPFLPSEGVALRTGGLMRRVGPRKRPSFFTDTTCAGRRVEAGPVAGGRGISRKATEPQRFGRMAVDSPLRGFVPPCEPIRSPSLSHLVTRRYALTGALQTAFSVVSVPSVTEILPRCFVTPGRTRSCGGGEFSLVVLIIHKALFSI